MADDTLQSGTDTIATDHVTTLNGVAVTQTATSPKVQRTKTTFGDDGTSRDVSAAFPLPVAEQVTPAATGTITATDAILGVHAGAGVPLTGTPTAGSYVAFPLRGGESGFTLRLSGSFGGGTVWMESSVDSTNGVDGGWTTNLVRQSGVDQTFLDASITTIGIFRGVAAGYAYLRVRVTGATTPSIGVAFRASSSPSVTAQVAPLPPGSNQVGNIGLIHTAATGTASGNINTATLALTAAQTANTLAIAAPAAGLSIYVTDMHGSNSGSTGTLLGFHSGATTTPTYAWYLPPTADGFVTNLGTPWKLPAATALNYRMSAASTTVYATLNYYIAP